MPTPSARLGIAKPITTDNFDTAEIAANWQILDDHPGTFIEDSGSPPVWGIPQEGMLWSQPDTGLVYRWDGATFQRLAPTGHLGRVERTTDFIENTAAFQTVTSVGVMVPEGNRRIRVVASWRNMTGDDAFIRIRRGVTDLIERFYENPDSAGSIEFFDLPGGSGAFTYALRMKTDGTTTTMEADTTAKITLDVVEV
jgi:hypothetical protein